jgi:hypothetical protein
MDRAQILEELEAERDRLDGAIAALQGNRRNIGMARGTATPINGRKGKRRMSAAARKKISDAQKARWAKQKKAA